jgi:histo-blood group ABO system transferase
MVIATGKYTQYVNDLVTTANKYFFHTHNLKIYLFTDDMNQHVHPNVVKIYQEHEGFPKATLHRYHTFIKNKDLLTSDYLYYCDVDMRFYEYISEDVLPNESGLVATEHPGFFGGRRGSYETNRNSTAYVGNNEFFTYCAGGFNGGTKESFLNMSQHIVNNINSDHDNNIIAVWHDESHMNRYFINHNPKILSPSYCYPENYWQPIPFKCRLMALDKNHKELRS